MKNRTSVFKGRIGTATDQSNFPIIILEDEDGWRIDLNSRLQEVVMNHGSASYGMSMFFSEKPTSYKDLKERWLYQLVGGYITSEKDKYDCQYSSYTRWTEYNSELKLGGHDIKKIFEDNVGKWVYIKIDVR